MQHEGICVLIKAVCSANQWSLKTRLGFSWDGASLKRPPTHYSDDDINSLTR